MLSLRRHYARYMTRLLYFHGPLLFVFNGECPHKNRGYTCVCFAELGESPPPSLNDIKRLRGVIKLQFIRHNLLQRATQLFGDGTREAALCLPCSFEYSLVGKNNLKGEMCGI